MQGTTSKSGNGGAQDTAVQIGDKAHAGLDRLTESAHSTIDRVAAAAGSAADRLTDGRLATTAQEWHASSSAYVREHPLAAIGIAVAAGYLLSRLTSSFR